MKPSRNIQWNLVSRQPHGFQSLEHMACRKRTLSASKEPAWLADNSSALGNVGDHAIEVEQSLRVLVCNHCTFQEGTKIRVGVATVKGGSERHRGAHVRHIVGHTGALVSSSHGLKNSHNICLKAKAFDLQRG